MTRLERTKATVEKLKQEIALLEAAEIRKALTEAEIPFEEAVHLLRSSTKKANSTNATNPTFESQTSNPFHPMAREPKEGHLP